MATAHDNIWSFVDDTPAYADAVAELWHWSTNYDCGKGPITLFLDLIGWSDDNLGEPLYNLKGESLGYVELSKLASALDQYTDRPADVRAWIDELLAFDEA
jgi:hypothetical protein